MILDRLKNLSNALMYYKDLGYQELEVPWIVSNAAIGATIPTGCDSMDIVNYGSLVASGEQSFIQLWIDGKLPDGKYCCCTPCFRAEPVLTKITRTYFLKVELIDVGAGINEIPKMLEDAFNFYKKYIPNVEKVKTGSGYDIYSNEIELGSYGYRTFGDMWWVYGTGCAEPRFSYCIRGK